MTNKKIYVVAAALTLAATTTACATTLTHGALSREAGSPFIYDALSGNIWTGWDSTSHLNYTRTLAAIGPGGEFEGWNVAGESAARAFLQALVAGEDCSLNVYENSRRFTCSIPRYTYGLREDVNRAELLLGESAPSPDNSNYDIDSVYFWGTPGDSVNNVGKLTLNTSYSNNVQILNFNRAHTSVEWTEMMHGYASWANIGFLLWRPFSSMPSSSVPAAPTAALLAVGALSVMLGRRSRASKRSPKTVLG